MEEMAVAMTSLNIPVGDTRPEARALLAAVASAAVSTSSPVSKSGYSKAADDENVSGNVESHEAGTSGSGTSDKDNDVEGKLFVGGISWQTTEDGLR